MRDVSHYCLRPWIDQALIRRTDSSAQIRHRLHEGPRSVARFFEDGVVAIKLVMTDSISFVIANVAIEHCSFASGKQIHVGQPIMQCTADGARSFGIAMRNDRERSST